MATTTFHKGKRPRIEVYNDYHNTWEQDLPDIFLTQINSKTATFRSPHVIGGLAAPRELIRPAIGTIVRLTEGPWAGFLATTVGYENDELIAEPFGVSEYAIVSFGGVDYLEQEEK